MGEGGGRQSPEAPKTFYVAEMFPVDFFLNHGQRLCQGLAPLKVGAAGSEGFLRDP